MSKKSKKLSDSRETVDSTLVPAAPAPVNKVWSYSVPILIVIYIVLAMMHMQNVPTGQTGYQNAPDEAAHLLYVRKLASGHLPNRAESQSDPIGYEWHQPPLYYALAVPLSGMDDKSVRYVSIVLGILCILFAAYAAKLLYPDCPIIWALAAAFPALIPTHIAITSSVNNDVLLELCFSGSIIVMLLSLQKSFSISRAVWLGVWISAALLAKSNGLLLIPIVLAACLLFIKNGQPIKTVVTNLGIAFITILILSGWWFVHNFRIYGELLPLRAFEQAFSGTIQAKDVASGKIPGLGVENWNDYFILVSKWTFQSFWAVFGTARSAAIGAPRFLPDQYYQLMGILTLCIFCGLVRAHFRKDIDYTLFQQRSLQISWIVLIVVGFSFAGFVLKYFQTQGRYLFPAMLPLSLMFAVGWRSIIPEKYFSAASIGILSLLTVLALLFIRYTVPA